MQVKSIKSIKNLSGRVVLLRVDFNVPVQGGRVMDNYKIENSLPTIEYLLNKKAKVVLLTHLGRPIGYDGRGKSGYDKKFDLKPVVRRISELLKKPIKFVVDKKIGRANDQHIYFAHAQREIDKMKAGEVVILENMRFFPEEAEKIIELSKKLASLGDIFVLDGFAVAHRYAASVSGVAKFLSSYAGLLLEKEIVGLNKIMQKPKRPLVVVLGGIKMETKIPVLDSFLKKANNVLLGGGIFNTYLWATGHKVGSSLIDKGYKKEALKYCRNKKVVLPIDIVAGRQDGSNARVIRLIDKLKLSSDEVISDIGPETIRLFAQYIKKANTLVWNGALGHFEQHPYEYGTRAIARLLAARSRGRAFGVCGGGETVELLRDLKLMDEVDLVSTGGGAMLEYLGGKKLPGVEAIIKH
jgi:phosphoglycerate kinase